MARRMYINAIHPEECRIAIAEDGQLVELEIERADQAQLRGNIYKAAIIRVEPSLQAAFLDIGSHRNGFLQINDIHPTYFLDWPPEGKPAGRPTIQDVLRTGQELVVQVVKDERDAKGATLTTNISIPGRFLVLMIGNQRGGVSRKISDEGQRFRLRQAVQKLQIPAGMGVIVRTAGINKSSTELQRDLDALLDNWYDVLTHCSDLGAPRLLYKESDLAIRTIRDYLSSDIDEILIDEPATYRRVHEFVEKTMPMFASRITHHEDPRPLFSTYHLDGQVDSMNHPDVTLPSGGSIVISVTEAIVAIDVNSGRSTGQADVEETAFKTNREAAEIIARQLRLRDLGGLIVIDFIDMLDRRHKQVVERILRDAVRPDKAKVEIGRLSKFGLLEMSRQRLKTSLVSQNQVVCPHCSGRGRVRTAESAALEALRKIQSAAFAGGVAEIRIRMSPAAALLLLNNKRRLLTRLEEDTKTHILVYADGRMKPEEYELELIANRRDDLSSHSLEATRIAHHQPAPRMQQREEENGGDGGGDSRRSGNSRRGRRGRRNRRRHNRHQEGALTESTSDSAPSHDDDNDDDDRGSAQEQ